MNSKKAKYKKHSYKYCLNCGIPLRGRQLYYDYIYCEDCAGNITYTINKYSHFYIEGKNVILINDINMVKIISGIPIELLEKALRENKKRYK